MAIYTAVYVGLQDGLRFLRGGPGSNYQKIRVFNLLTEKLTDINFQYLGDFVEMFEVVVLVLQTAFDFSNGRHGFVSNGIGQV